MTLKSHVCVLLLLVTASLVTAQQPGEPGEPGWGDRSYQGYRQDTVYEVTYTSASENIATSFFGVIVGFILFGASVWLLFYNEGRSRRRAQALDYALSQTQSKDRPLTHISGQATTDEVLQDHEFGVAVNAIKLQRKVLIFQWEETTTSRTEKVIGGGSRTITKYSYAQTWKEELVNSDHFKQPGHDNPRMARLTSTKLYAGNVVLAGKYKLNASQIPRITGCEEKILVTDQHVAQVYKHVHDLANVAKISSNEIFVGTHPSSSLNSPVIGDMRVTFEQVKPCVISVLAKKTGDTFEPFETPYNNSIDLLCIGTKSAGAMILDEEKSNIVMTWALRFIGFLLMYLGILLIQAPIVAIANILPFLGDIVGFGVNLFSISFAFCLSTLVIAIAWFFYRPVLSIAVALSGFAMLYLFRNNNGVRIHA